MSLSFSHSLPGCSENWCEVRLGEASKGCAGTLAGLAHRRGCLAVALEAVDAAKVALRTIRARLAACTGRVEGHALAQEKKQHDYHHV